MTAHKHMSQRREAQAVAPIRRRRTLRDGALLFLGILFTAAAVVGLAGRGSWTLIDKPGRCLCAEANLSGWQLTYIAVPDPANFPDAGAMAERWREVYKRQLGETKLFFELQRLSMRNVCELACKGEKARLLAMGRSAYVTDVWRAQTRGVSAPNLPEPTVWIAGFPAWWLVVPAVILLFVPAYASWDRRRRLRWLRYCRTCGYDLTGNTTRVCSECGAPLPADMSPPPATVPAPHNNA